MHLYRALIVSLLVAGTAAAQPAWREDGAIADSVSVQDVSDPALPGKSFFATTVIDASVSRLCALIVDYADYPAFMPNTEHTRVVEASNDHALVDMTLGLPLGKIKRYRLRLQPMIAGGICRLQWKLVPRKDLRPDETIADTAGYWRLSPHPGDPGKTRVEYYVYADPGPVPFGLHWIVDIMSRDALPKTLEALRARAQGR